jgi:hypothetical protein
VDSFDLVDLLAVMAAFAVGLGLERPGLIPRDRGEGGTPA